MPVGSPGRHRMVTEGLNVAHLRLVIGTLACLSACRWRWRTARHEKHKHRLRWRLEGCQTIRCLIVRLRQPVPMYRATAPFKRTARRIWPEVGRSGRQHPLASAWRVLSLAHPGGSLLEFEMIGNVAG